jgi:Tfp pilus assembly protein PilV
MTTRSRSESGFVVIDALVAVLTLSLTGTVLTATAVGLLQREMSALDRSVALVMSQSLMRQYPLLGDQQVTDELFDYRTASRPYGNAHGLTIVEVEVDPITPISAGAKPILSFLAVEQSVAW